MTTVHEQTDQAILWHQCFTNFKPVFLLLREAIEQDPAELSQLEKEGIIQRFEYTFKLAWQVLKEKVENEGLLLDQVSAKALIRLAHAAKYINDLDAWLNMLDERELMSDTYDFVKFDTLIQAIRDHYLPLLDDWYQALLMEIHVPDFES